MTFRDGMDVIEAIALVEKAKAIETKALSDRARLLAERDGWREIALELLKAAMGDEAEAFRGADGEYSFPPLELVEAIGHEPRALLQKFWTDTTRLHAERHSIANTGPGIRMLRRVGEVTRIEAHDGMRLIEVGVTSWIDLAIGDAVFAWGEP